MSKKPRSSLAFVRLALELRQKEMADLLDCSTDTIKSIELRRLKLSESLAMKISAETGVDAWWLLHDGYPPILPSPEAVYLDPDRQMEWNIYSKKIFERVQAHKHVPPNKDHVERAQLVGMKDYARLRSCIESARKKGLFQVARYKLDEFLKTFEVEFGSDPQIFQQTEDWMEDYGVAASFIEKELVAARQEWMKVNGSQPEPSAKPTRPRRKPKKGE